MRIAERIFNRPLMISEPKLNTILHVFSQRAELGIVSGQLMESVSTPPAEIIEISDNDRRRAGYSARNGVGIIGIYGPLMHRVMDMEFPSGGPTTYADIRHAFDMALADDQVQGIVLDIDSPGGEVNGAFDLADYIFSCRSIKPITAVVNEQAFSAAYLLASAASKIVVPRTGGVGSIGVIATHTEFSKWEEENGITVKHVYAGARKADYSQHMPLSAEAEHGLQLMVDDAYLLFTETVAKHRGISVQQVVDTEAGVFEGKKAVKAKLADEVSAVDLAITNARRGKGTKILAASAQTAATEKKEFEIMTIEQLKEENPDLVAQIETEARKGMITQAAADTARSEAVTAETTRVMGVVTAAVGEETGKKLQTIVAANLDGEQVAALGLSASGSQTREQMLAAITAASSKGAGPVVGAGGPAKTGIDTNAIYANRQKAMSGR
jgi:signal peptide peptidase SppA